MDKKLQLEDAKRNDNYGDATDETMMTIIIIMKRIFSTGQLLGTFDHQKQFLHDKIVKKTRQTV